MRPSPKSAAGSPVRGFLLVLVVCGAAVAAPVQPQPRLPGLAFAPHELVRDLPWSFEVAVEVSGPPEEVHRVRFESSEPVARSAAGATYLRFELAVSTYADPAAAGAAFEGLLAEADPDTGLSYAWDRLLVRDARLYLLHAPCLFSEESFERIASRLAEGLREAPASLSREARCRGGGGGREAPATPQPSGRIHEP